MTIQKVCVCWLICSSVSVCGVVFQSGGKTFVYPMLGMKDISSENSFVRDLINIMLGTPPPTFFPPSL